VLNNPDFRSPRSPDGVNWASPVALQPANELAADGDATRPSELDYDDRETHEHGQVNQHSPAHGLMSELVLTAMVVMGVALTTLAALYTAGAFRPSVHHPLPASPAASQTPGH
jgi:hypothetical protein